MASDNLDAAALKYDWAPTFLATVRKMLAEAKAQREAGLIMPYRGLSEGRNDWQNYKLGNDWSK